MNSALSPSGAIKIYRIGIANNLILEIFLPKHNVESNSILNNLIRTQFVQHEVLTNHGWLTQGFHFCEAGILTRLRREANWGSTERLIRRWRISPWIWRAPDTDQFVWDYSERKFGWGKRGKRLSLLLIWSLWSLCKKIARFVTVLKKGEHGGEAWSILFITLL